MEKSANRSFSLLCQSIQVSFIQYRTNDFAAMWEDAWPRIWVVRLGYCSSRNKVTRILFITLLHQRTPCHRDSSPVYPHFMIGKYSWKSAIIEGSGRRAFFLMSTLDLDVWTASKTRISTDREDCWGMVLCYCWASALHNLFVVRRENTWKIKSRDILEFSESVGPTKGVYTSTQILGAASLCRPLS